MRGQLGFFDVDDRLKRLSDLGDRLEAFRAVVDFELFRAELNVRSATRTDRKAGDRSSPRVAGYSGADVFL